MFYGQCNDCGERWELGTSPTCKCPDEALASEAKKPDFWEGYAPEPVKPATEESSATQAQQALDKMAENARELGLDYEPAQQEPVAFLDWYDNAHWGNEDFKDGCWRAWDAALEHTSPPAQRTWVSLTDEEIYKIDCLLITNITELVIAIEAKLKEKNNG